MESKRMFDIAFEAYRQIKFDGVATFSDTSIIALGMLSDYLGLDYFSEETARVLVNKLEVRNLKPLEGLKKHYFIFSFYIMAGGKFYYFSKIISHV